MSEPRRRSTGGALLLALSVAVVLATVAAVAVAVLAGPSRRVPASRVAADAPCAPAGPSPEAPTRLDTRLDLVPVGTAEEPTWFAADPERPHLGVLTERRGRVRMVEDGVVADAVVVDLAHDTADDGDGGLLAAVYDPAGGWLYLWRSTPEGDDVLTAHRLDADGVPAADGRVVLRLERPPSKQHHGGAIAFGADGYLYLGVGDGGGLGDPRENAQDATSLLGKVLRIRPTPEAARPYAVPDDNPFADRYGWAPEIWALGVRNPFRASTDGAGTLWLGDVGQTCWEEINRLAPEDAGANLGWDRLEGDAEFEGGSTTGRYHAPVWTQAHDRGWCAIVAGYVPRGGSVPALDGLLLYTDYCAGDLRGLVVDGDGPRPPVVDLGLEADNPVAIVPGPTGAPWVLTLDGAILELRSR